MVLPQIVTTYIPTGQPTISMIIICLCYRRHMMRPLTTTYLLISLSMLGACEQRALHKEPQHPIHVEESPNSDEVSQSTTPGIETATSGTERTDPPVHLTRIDAWLTQGDLTQIKHYVLAHYSTLSSSDLDAIKQRLLRIGDTQSNALAQLALTAELFDDNTSWQAYAQLAERERHWHPAHAAYLRLSQLEVQPEAQEQALSALVRTSAYLRNELERNGDLIGIQLLYQELVDLHPGFTRFRLELAHANLHQGDYERARQLYEELRYDAEFGVIAEHALESIKRKSTDNRDRNEIVIPLETQGSSMLVTVTLNQQSATLLLDTGASITALNQATIRALNLRPTGEHIWLTTANGQRQAAVYSLNQLTLGQFKLNRVLIAEVELEQYDGLLGTDLLNLLARDYNYRLENNPSRLVFTPKR